MVQATDPPLNRLTPGLISLRLQWRGIKLNVLSSGILVVKAIYRIMSQIWDTVLGSRHSSANNSSRDKWLYQRSWRIDRSVTMLSISHAHVLVHQPINFLKSAPIRLGILTFITKGLFTWYHAGDWSCKSLFRDCSYANATWCCVEDPISKRYLVENNF